MKLNGKKVFITASGQGIGRAITERFIEEKATVFATDINYELIKDIQSEKKELDVMNKSELQTSISSFNPDILINCAGFVHSGKILDAEDDQFDFAVSLNIKSMFHSIQVAIPLMIKKGGGSIINISSVVSSIIGAPNRFIYGTTKAAVIGLTKSVAVDYVKQGIRCNAICPGTVESPSLEERLHAQGDYEKTRAEFVARQPMGRIGEAEEIAALVVYLASDESAYTTGQAFNIDGGWSI